jgi:hypothetical protein
MRKHFFVWWLILLSVCTTPIRLCAQEQEIAQLLLNVEKLSQLKQILQQMYDGYKIISEGYDRVKDIASGNFQLHEVFLDGLYLVNPEIKKYRRVSDIIRYQLYLVSEYKNAYKSFVSSKVFNENQLKYLSSVYKNLFDKSMHNLDELLMVVTSRQLRMSDDERIQAIDRIFQDMKNKLVFLRDFNRQNAVLAAQLLKDRLEIESIKSMHGLK